MARSVAAASLPAARSGVDTARLVVGAEIAGDARAYPLQLVGYHHQVRDTVGGRPILVTYCTVCRTGRAFHPTVGGRVATFRLVGMDHFNAMLEDRATGSWWRQANGEAVAGPLRGAKDHACEKGTRRSTLTGTDAIAWREKAWVVGLTVGGHSRAYDRNRLRREHVVNDTLAGTPVLVALAADETNFYAYAPPGAARLTLRGDSLVADGGRAWSLGGHGAAGDLAPLQASQEFWHSWRTFHPGTTTY